MSKQSKEDLHLGENELVDWLEKKLGHLKPYTSQIILGITLIFAAFVAITYFVNARQNRYADQWRELSLASTDLLLSQNTTRLLNLAEDYPNQKAAMWSLQIAGDSELQTGLAQLSYDREGGFAIIKRARTNLQKVVDASKAIKSDELQHRALFSLAYACESLGEFDEAKKYYEQLINESPDAAFAEPARRGLARSQNTELIALYENFKNWSEGEEEAPGPPNLDFPDIDSEATGEQTGDTENDFDGGESASTGDSSTEATTTAAPSSEGGGPENTDNPDDKDDGATTSESSDGDAGNGEDSESEKEGDQ